MNKILQVLLLSSLPIAAIDSVVVFNEIHYHPYGDQSALEYVELYNQLAVDVDLSNWKIDGDITFDFPEGTVLGGGGYLVIAKDPSSLSGATGFGSSLGPYGGGLSNSGKPILLYNNNRSFSTAAPAVPNLPPEKLWSVDLQGDGNEGSFGQLSPPNPMNGTEANSGLGGVWNAFTIPGHSGTATDPTMNLVDSAGAASSVSFSITGTITGWSQNGNALVSDYLFLNAGNSDSSITWEISGLAPGETYTFYGYGGVSRDISLTLDRDGDGSLSGETAFAANSAGLSLNNITASAAGVIKGSATQGSVSEGNWAGFQIFEQQALTSPPIGIAHPGLEGRRIMDVLDFSDTDPWPQGPDGSGFTLAKIDPTTGTGHPENWSTSGQANGSPGSDNTFGSPPTLAFNETSSVNASIFEIEILNHGTSPISLNGLIIASSDPTHPGYLFPASTLAPGQFQTIKATTLGFAPADNDRLFFYTAGKEQLIDTLRADNSPQARFPDGSGPWLRPPSLTMGSPNLVNLHDRIVINEIFYHAYAERDEEWIELFNRSGAPVDLSDWALDGGISYNFEPGTTLGAGEYLVLAKDALALGGKHPGINIVGNFSGQLSNSGESLTLRDASTNPVDQVRYFDSGKWHSAADGGGSSLELRDPDSDNAVAGSWSPSDESSRTGWQTFTYEGIAVNDGIGNNVYHEFLIALLDAGEFLLDDVSVIENGSLEFIQNGDFESDSLGSTADKWRAVGTHGSHGKTVVVTDPDDAGNQCLHVVATGPTEDKHNKLETTFTSSERVVPGRTYRITFRAKWLTGSNQVNTRLYFNFLQKTHLLPVATTWGTPGAINSTSVSNAGPALDRLSHFPVVPNSGQATTATISANDPDGVNNATLFYSVNDASFQNSAMTSNGDGTYSGTIPGQSAGSIVRFYVQAIDTASATSFYPSAGSGGGAFFKVQDGLADNSGVRHNFRIVMSNRDRSFLFTNTNRLSNDRFPVTVIEDEEKVYYNVGLRLKASAFGRFNSEHYGFNIRFQPDRLFRGVHETVSVERSPNLKEILAKHLMNRAGGTSASFYDDVAHIITPTTGDRGIGLLSMARHTGTFFDGLFPDAEETGTLFNHELLYNPNGTNGGPEGLKIGNPYNHTGGRYDLEDRGLDKEPYRWGFQIRSARGRDDYRQLVALNQAMELNGTALQTALDDLIDVDQWMRTFAMMSLNGTDDIYSRIWEHNFRYYVRPTDQKIIIFQWDLDRSFQLGTTSSVTPDRNSVTKLFAIPPYRRLFDGHLNDLIETTFNSTYTNSWASHFSTLTGNGLTGLPGYISGRATFTEGSLPSEIPFVITTNGGNDFSEGDSAVDLAGNGWIDVFRIDVDGIPRPVTWIDTDSWLITVPISIGPNPLTVKAYNNQGLEVGSDSITVTNTSTITLANADNTIIRELHYHPAGPTASEIAAGFADRNAFEFIEILNVSDATDIDLSGTRFTDGVDFTFPQGITLAPGDRLIIVANQAAFEFRYGSGLATIAGEFLGQLKNSGEHVRFEATDSSTIADFTYGDNNPWPESADGSGYSLVFSGSDPDSPLHWRTSADLGGTPGSDDGQFFTGTADQLVPYALRGTTTPIIIGDAFQVSFLRNLVSDDALVIAEYSTNLVNWTPLTFADLQSRINQGDGTTKMTYQTPLPLSAEPRQFVRLRAMTR